MAKKATKEKQAPTETETRLQELAGQINGAVKRGGEEILAIGEALVEARELLKGEWKAWAKESLVIGYIQALKYIAVYEGLQGGVMTDQAMTALGLLGLEKAAAITRYPGDYGESLEVAAGLAPFKDEERHSFTLREIEALPKPDKPLKESLVDIITELTSSPWHEEATEANKRVKELEAALAVREAAIQAAQDAGVDLSAKIKAKFQTELEQAREAVSKAETERADLAKRAAKLAEKEKDVKELEASTAAKIQAAVDAELTNIRGQVEAQSGDLQKDNQQLLKDMKRHEKNVATLTDAVKQEAKAKEELEQKSAKLEADLAEAQAKLKKANKGKPDDAQIIEYMENGASPEFKKKLFELFTNTAEITCPECGTKFWAATLRTVEFQAA